MKALLAGAVLVLATVAVALDPAGAAVAPATFRFWGPNTQYAGSAETALKVNDLARLGDTVYVGGGFAEVRPEPGAGVPPVARPNLYAVDARTGSLVSAFAPDVNGPVEALEVDPVTGALFVGGRFTRVNGQDVPGFAVLDGATGALRPVQRAARSGGGPGVVMALRRVGRQLYVGGSFGALGGVGRGNVARLSIDAGLAVDGFQVFVTGLVRTLDVDPANPGRLYVGGEFSGARQGSGEPNWPGTQWLAAFHTADGGTPPGRLDTAFVPNVPCDVVCDNPPRGRKLVALNGLVYVAHGGGGGRFIIYRQADGVAVKTYNVDGDVQALAAVGDRILVGGHFTKINNPSLPRCQLFSIRATGRFEVLGDPAFQNGAHLGIFALLPEPEGSVLAGGHLTAPSDGSGPACDAGPHTATYNHIVRLVDGATTDQVAPSVPVGVRAGAAAFTSVNLTWSPSSDATGVSAYTVVVDGVRRVSVPGDQTKALVTGLAAGRAYQVAIQALDPYGNCSALSAPVVVTTGQSPPALPSPLRAFGQFFPTVTPARLLDTRIGIGGPAAAVAAGAPRTLTVVGAGGVPATGVQLVALNVTVIGPDRPGYLTVYPTGEAPPGTSNVNFRAGQTVPNLVVARVGAGGTVQLAVSAGATHLAADVVGWFASAAETTPGARLETVAPERVLDTRNGIGAAAAAPVGAGGVVEVQVVPPGAGYRGVVVNLTGVAPTADTYVTAYPAGEASPPNASNLNLRPGDIRPNLVMVGVSPSGRIKLFNAAGSTHLVVDVVGRFKGTNVLDSDPSGRLLALTAPARLYDSRLDPGAPLGPGSHRVDFAAVQGSMPAGVGVQGLVVNATATGAAAPTYLTLYPGGAAVPNASNLNVLPGEDVANLAVARLSDAEALDIFNATGSVHQVLDVTALVLG